MNVDCNDNDIAGEGHFAECEGGRACDDCKENEIRDAYDITAEFSDDDFSNGIPGECEEESSGGNDVRGREFVGRRRRV